MTMTAEELSYKDQVKELKDQIRILELQLEGNIPDATFWLYRKVHAQRAALDKLNHRVVSQRFVLRTLEELGRGLSREEYISARDRQPDNLKARIAETE